MNHVLMQQMAAPRKLTGVADAPPESFAYTGAAQTTTVPAGQNFVTVNLIGGGGAGFAGRVVGKLAVTPGASVQVNVGGTATAFNGGGAAGTTGTVGPAISGSGVLGGRMSTLRPVGMAAALPASRALVQTLDVAAHRVLAERVE